MTGVLLVVPAASTLTGDTALGRVEAGVAQSTADPRSTDIHAPTDPHAPTRIVITAIGVVADVGPVGLASDGELALPPDPADAGWFTGSSRPGDTGPAVLVGHLDSRDGAGAFAGLYRLEIGDVITVWRRDGVTVSFGVTSVSWHPRSAFPTQAVYGPTPDAQLRLITCGGTFDRRTGYSNNVVVLAKAARDRL